MLLAALTVGVAARGPLYAGGRPPRARTGASIVVFLVAIDAGIPEPVGPSINWLLQPALLACFSLRSQS